MGGVGQGTGEYRMTEWMEEGWRDRVIEQRYSRIWGSTQVK